MEILRVKDLKTYFNSSRGTVRAVDGVSFSLGRGETLGIIGESGAGKSVTALSVMGLAPLLGACLTGGQVWYRGLNMFEHPNLYPKIRGRRISLIPQEAGSALNPVVTVAGHIGEMLRIHMGLNGRALKSKIIELIKQVELSEAEEIARLYPHQLSGGILQRVLLAMAICCEPEIIIADEPASALDVKVQSEVLQLLANLKVRRGLSTILICHDLTVISRYCDRILVMYSGRIVEAGTADEILINPVHPYTRQMIKVYKGYDIGFSTRSILTRQSKEEYSAACSYYARCPNSSHKCLTVIPELCRLSGSRVVACHHLGF